MSNHETVEKISIRFQTDEIVRLFYTEEESVFHQLQCAEIRMGKSLASRAKWVLLEDDIFEILIKELEDMPAPLLEPAHGIILRGIPVASRALYNKVTTNASSFLECRFLMDSWAFDLLEKNKGA